MKVPEGQPTIAHRFNGGFAWPKRAESRRDGRNVDSYRPCGACFVSGRQPAVETVGYSRLPLPGQERAAHDPLVGLAERLTALSRACWERGRQLPVLALAKVFKKEGEAYHVWNAALPGHVPPAPEFAPPFASTKHLGDRLKAAIARREQLRAEMIALQEEMDWLVHAACGLVAPDAPCGGSADFQSAVSPICNRQGAGWN